MEPPSAAALASYLSRLGFSAAAINPASKAFLETCYLLQRERAYESDGAGEGLGTESAPTEEPEPFKMNVSSSPTGQMQPRPHQPLPPPAALTLNDPNLSIRSGTVHIEALLDFEGLEKLEDQIKALRLIMKPAKAASATYRGEPQHDALVADGFRPGDDGEFEN